MSADYPYLKEGCAERLRGEVATREAVCLRVAACVKALGFDVVNIEMPVARGHMIYRIFIDTNPPGAPGFGVTADDCAEVSRGVGTLLDELDPFSESYTLEVSSPGLFRELKTDEDWKRAIGKRVRLKPYTGRTVIGTLLESSDGYYRIHDNKWEVRVPIAIVSKANLQPLLDFGEAS